MLPLLQAFYQSFFTPAEPHAEDSKMAVTHSIVSALLVRGREEGGREGKGMALRHNLILAKKVMPDLASDPRLKIGLGLALFLGVGPRLCLTIVHGFWPENLKFDFGQNWIIG